MGSTRIIRAAKAELVQLLTGFPPPGSEVLVHPHVEGLRLEHGVGQTAGVQENFYRETAGLGCLGAVSGRSSCKFTL